MEGYDSEQMTTDDAADKKLYGGMYEIERTILTELVAGTPEEWTKIRLEVSAVWEGNVLKLDYDITSPEGHDASDADYTDDLKAAVEKMILLNKEHGLLVTHYTNLASYDGDDWRAKTNYTRTKATG